MRRDFHRRFRVGQNPQRLCCTKGGHTTLCSIACVSAVCWVVCSCLLHQTENAPPRVSCCGLPSTTLFEPLVVAPQRRCPSRPRACTSEGPLLHRLGQQAEEEIMLTASTLCCCWRPLLPWAQVREEGGPGKVIKPIGFNRCE